MRKIFLLHLFLLIAMLISASLFAEVQPQTKDFSIISRTAGSMDIRFDLPSYKMTQEDRGGTGYQKFTIQDAAYLSDIGLPELPVLSTMIAIPFTGSARVELVDSHSTVRSGILPYPVQNEDSQDKGFSLDTEYYSGNKSLPREVLNWGEPQIMRDLRVIQIQVNPFIWDANSHEMTIHDQIILRVSFSPDPGINELSGSQSISAGFDTIYASQILNYQDYRNNLNLHTPPRIVMLYGAYNDPIFQSQLNNFALWKRQKGAEVSLISTAVAGSSNTAIKAYLQGLYDNPQTRFDFLIIIGDVTGSFAVPAWYAEGFGDYPYQMLAGNDLLGDVVLGRISAENTAQLDVILAKIYAYEKNMNLDNAQWLNRMLLTSDTLYSGISVENLSYYIRDISLPVNPSYTYTMLNQNSPSPSAMNAAINQGVGFFNYRGYAGMSGWSVSDTNLYNINKLCHAVIITCNTGNYDATGTTELFIRVGSSASPKGAVTAIGMWSAGTATMPNNALSGGVFSGIFAEGMRTMGEALLYSKLNFSRLYAISNPTMCVSFNQWCNLMGDPSMEVYTTVPRSFASLATGAVFSGTGNLEYIVTDQAGYPIEDACVTVTHMMDSSAQIISRGYTDAAGNVYLPFSEEVTGGTLIITVSKHDFKPLQQTISVAGGSLLAGIPLIDDDNQGTSSGNGNGIANPGETPEILFTLRNTSANLIGATTGYISCNDPLITIADSLIAFPGILAGASAACLTPVSIQISPEVPNNTLLRFSIRLTDGEQNVYALNDYISVTDAQLSYESCQITGGGDSILDPGETTPFSVTLRNIGQLAVTDLTGELFSGNDLVAVVDSLGTYGSIIPNALGTTVTDNYILHGRDSLLPGMVIPLRLKLSNPAGFLQWLEFSLTVGTVTVNDPLGPDRHGYVIYDDTDTSYDECPSYNWIGIAPAEGGSGNALNINDPEAAGEGDDLSSASLDTVDLPFSFKFYGRDYQQITVCSNGFIVFGVTENCEFRNYRLPGPLGPAPMVAAFWDDLATGPGSGIYTHFDADNHQFVIEWYQMLNGYNSNYAETFQVILYDPAFYPTSYGDGPIKIQYHTFNNVDSGASNQSHGNFSSIGIESADQLDGLEYSFMNTYPTAASPLGNGRALYLTNKPVYYDAAWLVFGETVINDGNNHITEPGETIGLGVIVQNLGNHTASGIQANLSSYDPYVTISNNDSDYHPIAGHSHGINLDAFDITISPGCPDGHIVQFSLAITSNGNSWNYSFGVPVTKAGVRYDSFFLNDVGGNNNGYADPGEDLLLIVNVHNPSEVAVRQLQGVLSTTSNYLTISNSTIGLADLEGKEISQFVYQISMSPSTPQNSTIPLSFNLTSLNVPQVSAQFALGCGEMGMSTDLEDGNGGLVPLNGWNWGTPGQTQAHSGSKVWATGLAGQYSNGANFYLTTQPVTIGTGAELSFWHQMYCQGNFDGGNVSISPNNGTSWIVINPSSGGTYANSVYSMNEPGFTGTIGTWAKVTFDLSPYANSQILIRWHFTSDGSVTGFGWFLDDIMVSGFAVRSGVISGNVSLSEGGDPSSARVTAPFATAPISVSPNAEGNYILHLPAGTYTATASLPYHVTETSPIFIITDDVLDYVHDFSLTDLPPVTNFTLSHDEEESLVTLSWNAPEAPAYPVTQYVVYRKIGPGVAEPIGQIETTDYSEAQFLTGHYSYFVRPVYAPGEGAPSDTLELVILPPVPNDDPLAVPMNVMHANYPNPFNPSTVIPLDLAKAGTVQIKIFNLKGQLVKTLASGNLEAGQHLFRWEGTDEAGRPVSSGVYFCRAETRGYKKTIKMLMIK